MARTAAIDGGDWTGAGFAPAADEARLIAAPSLDRDPSSAPSRGGLAFAAFSSLAVHAAILAAAALGLGAPQPTGEPDAIVVELVASTGDAAPTPTADADLERATRDDLTPADATPSPPPPNAATPATAADAAAPPAPKAADAVKSDAGNETAPTPPAAPAQVPAAGDAPAVVSAAAPPTAQAEVAPPEADFAVPTAAPRLEPRSPAAPPRATARPKPSPPATGARASAARAAGAPAPARGAAELAAYRNALLTKIWSAARYPEAARERGATGVATVRFALDGVGAVTLADLAQSSGDSALDDEAVAAVRRASPLPVPPAGAPRAYSAPIRFELR